MRQLVIIANFLTVFLLGSSAFAHGAYVAIACNEGVTVYANAPIASGLEVVIEFVRDGEYVREVGNLSIRSDRSLVANSNSIVVYGNRLGTGYFILSPSRTPFAGHCQSVKN